MMWLLMKICRLIIDVKSCQLIDPTPGTFAVPIRCHAVVKLSLDPFVFQVRSVSHVTSVNMDQIERYINTQRCTQYTQYTTKFIYWGVLAMGLS